MDTVRSLEWGVVGIVLLTVLATSGAIGGVDVLAHCQSALGNGSATVAVESFPTERFRFVDGRFGTDVVYLRVPDVRVRVTDVSESPRLIYRVEIPALGVDRTATRLLTGERKRTVTIRGVDRGFDPETIDRGVYEATVSIRIQSFAVDRTVVSVNETVEVDR